MSIGRIMGQYPTLTAATQAGLLMCAGDLISQTAVEKRQISNIDFKRTARFGAMGFFIVGPVLRHWYGVLERNVVWKSGSPALTAVSKMAVDQLLFAPVFLFGFMGIMGCVNGQSWDKIKTDIRRDYPDIIISNYKLWPAAQLLNFWIVPIQHRVLFAQTVALVWNTYLSFKTNNV